jgi:nitrogen-specific signal transduction histidine kinase
MKRPVKRDSRKPPKASASNFWESWPGLLFKQRADCSFEWVSREMESFVGVIAKSSKQNPEQFWAHIHPADVKALNAKIESCARSGQAINHTYRVINNSTGKLAYVSESRRPLLDRKGKICGYECQWTDLTRQILAERQLLSSAWKTTLADLTPGLAHDFNNVLTGILAVSEVCLAQVDSRHPFHESLSLIKQKVQDASQLIHRIARLHQESPGCYDYQDVNLITAEVVDILSKVIPKRIEVHATLSVEALPVFLDAVEFRRLLLSLALSAVHAMAGSGKLHFKLSRHETLPALRHVHGALPCLPVACVAIAGFGTGFVTNLKLLSESLAGVSQTDDGASLSLHQARLFLEKNHGALSAETTPARGTTLCLWLPQSDFTEADRPNRRSSKSSLQAEI